MPYQKVREDFTQYPSLCTDSSLFMCQSGYFYARTTSSQNGRPVYARINIVQTFPEHLPLGSLEAKTFLREDALQILADLESGKIQFSLYGRYKKCCYSSSGKFTGLTNEPHTRYGKAEHPYAPNSETTHPSMLNHPA